MADVLDRVRAVIAEQLQVTPEEVPPDTDLYADNFLDSLEIEMIFTLEEEFDFEISEAELLDLEPITPRKLAAYIEAYHAACR